MQLADQHAWPVCWPICQACWLRVGSAYVDIRPSPKTCYFLLLFPETTFRNKEFVFLRDGCPSASQPTASKQINSQTFDSCTVFMPSDSVSECIMFSRCLSTAFVRPSVCLFLRTYIVTTSHERLEQLIKLTGNIH